MQHSHPLVLTLTLLLTLAAVEAPGQAMDQGYLALGQDGTFYRIETGGQVHSARLFTEGLTGPVVDLDNGFALVAVPRTGTVLRIDPATLTVVGTVATGLGKPVSMVMDPDGYLLVADMNLGALLKVSRTGQVSTLLVHPGILKDPHGGMEIHVDSTELLIQETDPSLGAPLYKMRRNGTQITTLATSLNPGHALAQHYETGDLYIASADTQNTALYRLGAGSAVASTWLAPSVNLQAVASLALERSSTPSQRLLVGAYDTGPSSRGLYTVELATRKISRIADIPGTLTGVAFARSRNLASYRTERGLWTLKVSFPDKASQQYVILPTLHGVRPAQVLPDGRRACIVPDGLTTHLAFVGDIAPYTHAFRGQLDASGSAMATLDLRILGPWANGLVVWFLAATIHRSEPLSIGAISDPMSVELG